MTERHVLNWHECKQRAGRIVEKLGEKLDIQFGSAWNIYGVPRGGVPVALLVQQEFAKKYRNSCLHIVERPEDAHVLADDILDTGATCDRYLKRARKDAIFVVLVDKQHPRDKHLGWVVFPWELEDEASGPTENVRRLLEFIGDPDPMRQGLKETPERVIRSYAELFSGYGVDVASIFKVFDEPTDQMVLLRNIEFYSTCEHHMLPFEGVAHVAYIPDRDRVVGLSKLARLVDAHARRLQIQERIGTSVVGDLMEHLTPKGAACMIEARHFCMVCRGANKQRATMVTSSLRGAFLDEPATRAEFFSLVKG